MAFLDSKITFNHSDQIYTRIYMKSVLTHNVTAFPEPSLHTQKNETRKISKSIPVEASTIVNDSNHQEHSIEIYL